MHWHPKDIIAKLLNNRRQVQDILLKASVYPRFAAWKSSNAGKDHINGEPREKRNALFQHVCDRENLLVEPLSYLEFGVHRGESIAWWYNNNRHPESCFAGFDSFEGLPEDWTSTKGRGAFDTGGLMPHTDDARVTFVKGWFHKTLPCHLPQINPDKRRVVHLDADLYRSTIYPLLTLGGVLRPGDILIFDEFADSIHEYRAFEDFSQIFAVKTSVLGGTVGFSQVAMKIDQIDN